MALHSISENISENIVAVQDAISQAARAADRNPEDVRLIAVSKRKPASAIAKAASAGIEDFGENFLQEAIPKIETLAHLGLRWHFIGAIQSNKTRAIATYFQWIHTIERVKIARRLSEQCPEGKTLNLCIQVNVDADPNKAGVAPEDTAELLDVLMDLPRVKVRGLMTMLERSSEPGRSYALLAEIFDSLRSQADQWDTLSMGMSGDYRDAISAGATQVRVGTAIFGPRS
ncbi:MAG: YggS family pyridoxal phosphate-dependent enzyme [Gammaproteobacteria bacterium]|nr:YggS family pyridoxal phosphate-dependent enzyme [Gammaproteobacteria bacterium]